MFEVGRGIHAGRQCRIEPEDGDSKTMGQRPQLLQSFRHLQRILRRASGTGRESRRGRHTGRYVGGPGRPAEAVARLAAKASRAQGIGAREKYSARSFRSVTTLTTFGLKNSSASAIACAAVAIWQSGLTVEQASHVVDHRGRDQWLVTLDVDDDLLPAQSKQTGCLGQSIGAGFMLRRREQRVDAMGPARRDDLLAVGGDHDPVSPGRLRALRYADHHGGAADIGERFAWQAG